MKIVCLVSLLLVGTASAFQTSLSSPQRTASSSTRTLNNQFRTPKPFQSVHTKPISTSASVANSKTQLQVLPAALAAVSAPVGSISVLAFVILVHEAGHFLAARSLDIKVKEFSVGVGPKLFGFTRKAEGEDEDEGIEFNLRAIPLGGYVRFPENYNATLEYQLAVEADTKRDEINKIVQENRENQPAGAAAGLLSSISLPFASGKVTKEERIKALETMAIQINDQEKSSNPWWKGIFGSENSPLKEQKGIIIEQDGTVSVPPVDYYNDPDLLQNRPPAQRSLVLVGGVVFNIILAFSLYFGELTIGNGLQKPVFGQGAVVTSVARANSAGVGILEKGDVILSVNGNFLSPENPTAYNSQDTVSSLISSIRGTAPGDALHLSVIKYNTKVASEIDLKPLPMNDNDGKSPLSIGVMIAPNYTGNKLMKATNPVDAAIKASAEVSELTSQTARGIFTLLGGLLSGSAPAGQSLSGPVGVIKQGSAVVAKNDVSAVIGFAAAISINLAVVNSLPLPALDGGQLLFVLSEALTGKKIDQRKQEEITSATLLFLFLVTISTTVGDVGSLFAK
mmetsp:Transcript_14192/g.21310  ORF Transcript_14192/g.21310 Transcript_14192/m.21310 type:complete len:567 (-) Transcript_14192:72-1772(-)